jgi:hypothetical protein
LPEGRIPPVNPTVTERDSCHIRCQAESERLRHLSGGTSSRRFHVLEITTVKKRALASLFLSFLLLCSLTMLTSCGQTYELVSLEVEPGEANLPGLGAIQQYQVLAHYSNTKTVDVTHQSSYALTPPSSAPPGYVVTPNAVRFTQDGMAEAVLPGACTWTGVTTLDAAGKPTTVYGTNPYTLTVTFEGKSAPAYISVASIAGCKFQ